MKRPRQRVEYVKLLAKSAHKKLNNKRYKVLKIWLPVSIALIAIIWLIGNSPPKRWIALFSLMLPVGLYICWEQYRAGCNFSLGDCYSSELPEYLFFLKVGFVVLSEALVAAALLHSIVLAIRRLTKNEST